MRAKGAVDRAGVVLSVTVLDAYAVIAALTDEPARPNVERILRDGTVPSRISAVNVAEVCDQLVRVKGRSAADVSRAIDLLVLGGLGVVDVDDSIARSAGEWRASNYHRVECSVSLADCVAAATAASFGEPLATSDAHLARLARNVNLQVVALPNTAGIRP